MGFDMFTDSVLYPHKFMWYGTLNNVCYVLLMPYANFLSELERANLSVRAFAELVGMNPNSISNYARAGELPTHLGLIAVLVAELGARGMDYRRVMSKVALAPKKPRGGAKRGHFGGDRQGDLDLLRGQTDG